MSRFVDLLDLPCPVCAGTRYLPIDFTSHIFSTRSSLPNINQYVNHICDGCGLITPYPQPNNDKLAEHYNSEYRASSYAVYADGRAIEPPIQIPISGYSFKRFQSYFDAMKRAVQRWPDAIPTPQDTIIDFGAYQGLFLYAARQAWGCQGIAYDYSEAGIEFARSGLGMPESRVTNDIYADNFPRPVRFATLVHVFEHLEFPNRFLQHLRDSVLTADGWLYIEVPNACGSPLSDVHHFYMYSQNNLAHILKKNGFEIVDLWLSGWPAMPELPFHNPKQNLHCLARVAAQPQTPTLVKVSALDIYAEARRSYRATALGYLRRDAGRLLKECFGLLLHSLGVVLLDLLPVSSQAKFNTPELVRNMLRLATDSRRMLLSLFKR